MAHRLNSIRQVGDDAPVSRVELDDPDETESAIIQPTWTVDDWWAYARHSEVQAVAVRMDLSTAEEIWAPSKHVAHALRDCEFDPDRILVRRLPQAER
jgi:hypothetical protein